MLIDTRRAFVYIIFNKIVWFVLCYFMGKITSINIINTYNRHSIEAMALDDY